MKITDFKLEKYKEILDRPLGDSNNPSGRKIIDSSLLIINTDEGISGVAPLGNDKVNNLFHLLESKDPREVFSHWKNMIDFVFKGGDEGELHNAISAIDIALWDLKAKINSEPLWRTLGGNDPKCKIYASDIGYNLSDEELFDFFSNMAEKGVDSGKVKIGLSSKDDIRRVGIVYEALLKASSRPRIMIDSNEYWSAKRAIQTIKKIEEKFDIFWAEEPARRWDYKGLKLVSNNIKAAVSTGENLNNVGDFYPLLANQAADILNVSSYQSGITGLMQISNFAYAYEIPVTTMNCIGNYNAQIAVNIPNHVMMEVVDPGREKAYSKWNNNIEDGFLHLDETNGIGLIIDENSLNKLKKESIDTESSLPPGRRTGAGLYIKDIEKGEVNWK
jgi:L-alanine-DL-glutamate epimerase-like enolase superfamily enzyme|tara:strand:- start:1179 stop:2345 length:1167 start_codon:yes stop_codon:yes gene_type:complete